MITESASNLALPATALEFPSRWGGERGRLGGLTFADLMRDHTQQMQGRRILRFDIKYLSIDIFCLIQTAGIMVFDGEPQRVLQSTLCMP